MKIFKSNNIGQTIMTLASVILIGGILISIILFSSSITSYIENKDFIKYTYDLFNDENLLIAGQKAITAHSTIIYSIILFIGSILSGFLLTGFGKLIINSDMIVANLLNNETDKIN